MMLMVMEYVSKEATLKLLRLNYLKINHSTFTRNLQMYSNSRKNRRLVEQYCIFRSSSVNKTQDFGVELQLSQIRQDSDKTNSIKKKFSGGGWVVPK